MDTRHLAKGKAYAPATLAAMKQAYEEAWGTIEATINNRLDREKVRARLARAVVSVTKDGDNDAETLKAAALEYMALNYKRRP
jgi:hypothetical protein